jgi:hypothetical protein
VGFSFGDKKPVFPFNPRRPFAGQALDDPWRMRAYPWYDKFIQKFIY